MIEERAGKSSIVSKCRGKWKVGTYMYLAAFTTRSANIKLIVLHLTPPESNKETDLISLDVAGNIGRRR